MCGICGIIDYQGFEISEQLQGAMCSSIEHRGPDHKGSYYKKSNNISAFLACQRLSIIDISGSNQPIENEAGNMKIVQNGEIFNFKEIRKELAAKGHIFKTKGDTEVILHGYEEWGAGVLQRLNGQFAFAIFDEKNGKLFMARDRVGIIPLYYTCNNRFEFASEAKSLLTDKGSQSINYSALSHYVSLRYIPDPMTLIEGISKLRPGCYAIVENGNIQEHEYWDLANFEPKEKHSEKHYIESFERIMEESVRLRLVSDVPVGIFLSGGIDSSLILAVMKRLQNEIEAFSIGFDAPGWQDELPYAKFAAAQNNASHNIIRINSNDYFNSFNTLSYQTDEPIGDPTMIPLYYLSKLASEKVKVTLSGEGSDEFFAGYQYNRRKRNWHIQNVFNSIPDFAIRAIEAGKNNTIARMLGADKVNILLQRRKNGYLPVASMGLSDEFKKEIFDPKTRQFTKVYPTLDFMESQIRTENWEKNIIRAMQYVDIKTWLAGDLLMRADKTAMAHSLEVRFPFLDHNLSELAFTTPESFKIKGKIRKYIVKKMAEKYYDKDFVHRYKVGFALPLDHYIKNRINDVKDILLSKKSRERGILDMGYIQGLISSFENRASYDGMSAESRRLFTMTMLELWCCNYLR